MLPGFRQLSFGALEDDCPNSRELNTIRKATNEMVIWFLKYIWRLLRYQFRNSLELLKPHCCCIVAFCILQQQHQNNFSEMRVSHFTIKMYLFLWPAQLLLGDCQVQKGHLSPCLDGTLYGLIYEMIRKIYPMKFRNWKSIWMCQKVVNSPIPWGRYFTWS